MKRKLGSDQNGTQKTEKKKYKDETQNEVHVLVSLGRDWADQAKKKENDFIRSLVCYFVLFSVQLLTTHGNA